MITSEQGYEQLRVLKAEVIASIESIMSGKTEIMWEDDSWVTDLNDEQYMQGVRTACENSSIAGIYLVIDGNNVSMWDDYITITDLLLVLQTIEHK